MNTTRSAAATQLRLELCGEHDVATGVCARIELHGEGASIGRGAGCDWQLDAAGVSRLHASVRHLGGVYFLEDHSTNGVLHNGTPLRSGFPAALRDGDRIRIDSFEIAVTVLPTAVGDTTAGRSAASDTAAGATAPVAAAPVPSVADASDDAFAALAPAPLCAVDAMVDPLALFSTSYTSTHAEQPPAAADWNHSPSLSDGYRAHVSTPGAASSALLPEHWDRTRSEFAMPSSVTSLPAAEPRPAPAIVPVVEPAPAPAPTAPAPTPTPTPTRPATAGADATVLLTALVAGLMDVLRARAEVKNSLRLPATLIRRSENNPLKFAATAEEAVARLLGPADPAYLVAAAAIDDAMHDIGQHQLALMAGMRAGFEHAFAHFDPARFEAETGAQGALAGWSGRPWRHYVKHYQELSADPDERFRRLFGDAFADAYEDQSLRARAAVAPHRERT